MSTTTTSSASSNYVPFNCEGQSHVNASSEGDGGQGIEEVRVEDRVEPALQLEDGRNVNRNSSQDEQDVEAGQHDQQVVERVLSHFPANKKNSFL